MLTFAQVKKRPAPVARRSPFPAAAGLGPMWHDNRALVRHALRGPALQTKPSVSKPGDALEREADRVADAVLRMPAPDERLSRQGDRPAPEAIQRMCAECSEELQDAPGERLQRLPAEEIEEGEELLQGKFESVQRQPLEEIAEDEEVLSAKEMPGQTPQVTPGLEAGLAAMRGGGKPLPESSLAFFSPRFGHDFSQVRVHSDPRAAEAARAVSARAFTLGRSIYFGQGQYQPESTHGKRLLAHELAHTVQQGQVMASLPAGPADDTGLIGFFPRHPSPSQVQRDFVDLDPPGDCAYGRHRALQNEVDAKCKRLPRGCTGGHTLRELEERIANNAACIRARVAINSICFRGGNTGHQIALREAIGSLMRCHRIRERLRQPTSGPEISPAAKRVGISALIGAGVGTVLGAILGAAGGGAGGTLVAPGVGTVAGGIAGGAAGAAEGAAIGGLAGGAIGAGFQALYEWLAN